MRFILPFFLIGLLFPFISVADEVTHQLGNSGYAVRWAMQEGANEKSHEHYRKAVELQAKARLKFQQRYISEAMDLSRQAEEEAKIAIKESKEQCISNVPAVSCYPYSRY